MPRHVVLVCLSAALLAAAGCAAEAPGPTPPDTPRPDAGVDPDPEPDPERPALDPVGEPCAGELAVFDAQIWQPILLTTCRGCHQREGAAKDSRFILVAGSDPEHLRKNWLAAGAVAQAQLEGVPLILLRASGRHPEGHPGGALILPGTDAYAALTRFAADATDPACNAPEDPDPTCALPGYGAPMLRRLTAAEYDATLGAVFSQTSTRGRALAADPAVGGFNNNAATLVVSALLADQLRLNAEDLGRQAALHMQDLLPCTPAGADDAACQDAFVRDFGARAFRRPLTEAEVARYRALFEATADGDFAVGVQWVVTALLQSPSFVYRHEVGVAGADGRVHLTGPEIASALAYFLTGAPPDAELRAAAAQGTLTDPDERERQARRLLASPAGKGATAGFFFAWLGLDRIETVAKDPVTFPELTPAVRSALRAETEHFLAEVLERRSGTLRELLSADYTVVTPELELYYREVALGERDADGYAELPGFGQRRGLLTQGSLLTVHGRANESSPIHRGKLVRERLLCQPLSPPPPGLVVQPPPVDPNLTTRERYAAHSEVEPCKSCHRLTDPIGFAFERFDGIGRYRETQAGRPIDTHGEIVDSPRSDGEFADLAGLADLLAASPDVSDCFTEKWLRYAYGAAPEAGLACALEEGRARFAAGGGVVSELLVSLARSEHLAVRTSTAGQ
jgi:hypothetical protein